MEEKILRKLFLGFIQIHILHHAKKEAFYGSWMITELQKHGYDMSPGTYILCCIIWSPMGITKKDKIVDGKVRKYYSITDKGDMILLAAREKAYELFKEIKD